MSSSQFSYRRRKKPPVESTPKGKKPTGRNVGKLMQIMNVPVDVFLEIASHLHPLDLLSLSRVSNDIRDILLSRRTKGIWMQARNNLRPPLPDCLDDLSEPLYASLVFERSCMACGAGRASWKVSYAIRIRFCGSCWKANVRSGIALARDLGVHTDSQLMSSIFQLLPRTHDYAPINGQGIDIATQDALNEYYAPDFAVVVQQYQKLRSGDEGVFKQFLEECQADARRRLIFYRAVAEWNYAQSLEKDKIASKAQVERITAIKLKLQELGYEEADYPIFDSSYEKMLYQPRPLTPRIWNSIRPKLIAILEPMREARRAAEFKLKWRTHTRWKQLAQYYTSFLMRGRADSENAWKRTMPNFATAVKMPHMLALLTAADPDNPLPEEQFAAIEEDVVKEGEEYRASARRDLVKILRPKEDVAMASSQSQKAATKGKASTNTSHKGKEKEELRAGAIQTDSKDTRTANNEQVADDETPLEAPTALFQCYACRQGWDSEIIACATGILGHWQEAHSEQEWNPQNIGCVPVNHFDIPGLLDALGLPKDTPLTIVEESLLEQPDKPYCACDLPVEPIQSRYHTLSRLLTHMGRRYVPEWHRGTTTQSSVAHCRITFAPAPEVVATATAA